MELNERNNYAQVKYSRTDFRPSAHVLCLARCLACLKHIINGKWMDLFWQKVSDSFFVPAMRCGELPHFWKLLIHCHELELLEKPFIYSCLSQWSEDIHALGVSFDI